MSVFIGGIPFCMKLNFLPGKSKAQFGLWIGENSDVKFNFEKNTIVGKAFYQDGFPLEYTIHPSLQLNDDQKYECEKLIHRAIAGMLPKLFLKMGLRNIQFTPTFPSYVVIEGPLLDEVDVAHNF